MSWFSDLFGVATEEEIQVGAEDEMIGDVPYWDGDDLVITETVGCVELHAEVGEVSHCRNTGKVPCNLCDMDDPDRWVNDGDGIECIDCRNTGLVTCQLCEGRGHIIIDGHGRGN